MEPLSTIIRDFSAAYPAMSVTADAAFTPEEVVQAVKTGRAEIGLLGASSSPDTSGLRVLPVEEQELVLLSPPDSPDRPSGRRGRRPTGNVASLRRADLAGMRLIVSKPGSVMRQLVDEVLASGVDAQIVVEVEHRTSILPMVLAGIGHAVMPSSWSPLAQRAGARVRNIEPAFGATHRDGRARRSPDPCRSCLHRVRRAVRRTRVVLTDRCSRGR